MANLVGEPLKKAFNDMLYLDVLRGEDSTGVAAISGIASDKPEVELFKSLGTPSDFFYEHNKAIRQRTLTYKPVNIYIGHNRFATQGKVIAENAHPFEYENVVGAHNGTVDMSSLRSFHGWKDLDVDSQIIYSHLSHTQSIDEVWKDADGAMALVWYDKVNKKLNMIRNSQRPLYVVYTADDKSIMWASESWMLVISALRNNLKLHDIIELTPNRLYTFDIVRDASLSQNGCVYHTERDLPPFVAKPRYYGYQQNYGRSYGRSSAYDDNYWDYFRRPDLDEKKGEEKSKATPKSGPTNFRITEFHDNAMQPAAFGYLEDGSELTVNIPVAKYKEAKDKITGRSGQGYYFATKIHRSALDPDKFWCNWYDCSWAKLKPEFKMRVAANGSFAIEAINNDSSNKEFAPWYDKSAFLNRSAYEDKVECGCGNCDRAAKWEDRNDILWVTSATYFCKDCKDLPIVKDVMKFAS